MQFETTALYIEALWEFNWNTILAYNIVNIIAFLILSCSVVMFPTLNEMFLINAGIAGLFLINEFRQLMREGFTQYFSEVFNYLDLVGQVLIIVSATDLSLSNGEDFYESPKNIRILVLGILLAGLRALSSLYIFKPFRVQITLFKQVFSDIGWFMSIVLMLILLSAIVFGVEHAMVPDADT